MFVSSEGVTYFEASRPDAPVVWKALKEVAPRHYEGRSFVEDLPSWEQRVYPLKINGWKMHFFWDLFGMAYFQRICEFQGVSIWAMVQWFTVKMTEDQFSEPVLYYKLAELQIEQWNEICWCPTVDCSQVHLGGAVSFAVQECDVICFGKVPMNENAINYKLNK